MKKRGATALVTAWVCAASCVLSAVVVSGQTAANSPKAMREVLAAEEARRLAMLRGDVVALAALLTDDVTIVWGDGTVDDKMSTLALFRSGRLRYGQLDYTNTRVRLYEKTAIVTGEARVQARSDEKTMTHNVRVTRVYVNQLGSWRLAASQTTRFE
ncbi:MAG: hypothetical protein NVS9B14_18650 [Candidatus Acidiferrum sp.]